jgi:hypothetical protein
MQVLVNVPDTLAPAIIQQQIKAFEERLIKQARKSEKIPNETTKAAMLYVRAKKNLENITLEQLQQSCQAQ